MRTKLLVIVLLVTVAFCCQEANAFRFSVGGFGGFNFPVAQDDAKMGTVFGAKARIPIIPFIAVEPNFTLVKNGDAEFEITSPAWNTTMKREAGKFTTFGVDAVFGSVLGYTGLNVYGIAGISSAKYARDVDAIPDLTEIGYWLGLGLEYAINDQIAIDMRGKLLVFAYDDGSRKNGIVTFGINYFFDMEGGQ